MPTKEKSGDHYAFIVGGYPPEDPPDLLKLVMNKQAIDFLMEKLLPVSKYFADPKNADSRYSMFIPGFCHGGKSISALEAMAKEDIVPLSDEGKEWAKSIANKIEEQNAILDKATKEFCDGLRAGGDILDRKLDSF